VTEEEWNDVINVNLTGVWNGCQVFGKHMIDAGGGVIVNIGSMSGQIVNRPQWQPAYNASKAAVHHLTKSLAAEWAPFGVRVNALAPGYVRTEMTPIDRPEFKRHWIDDTPQRRAATPNEIAPAVVFLASPASSYMTGSVLTIDGGYTVF
jgi:NAD(P)-dependent dehydrogenase (short-subunit alcohol dehydrogenase family)